MYILYHELSRYFFNKYYLFYVRYFYWIYFHYRFSKDNTIKHDAEQNIFDNNTPKSCDNNNIFPTAPVYPIPVPSENPDFNKSKSKIIISTE